MIKPLTGEFLVTGSRQEAAAQPAIYFLLLKILLSAVTGTLKKTNKLIN